MDASAFLVRDHGYRCDTVSSMRYWPFSEGVTMNYNNVRYEYEIQDKGGHMLVTVK